MTPASEISGLELTGIAKVNSGKVREIFAVGDDLLLVATDRMSAFDVVLPDPVPDKGKVLTQLSEFWLDLLDRHQVVPHHLITTDVARFPQELQPFAGELEGRSMLVRRAEPLAIECVVRGYLAGSGWSEYQRDQTVCGIRLPEGLVESSRLEAPIFTPATKAVTGHDENISFERAAEIVGDETAERVRDLSLEIYSRASAYASERGIIICDTKFEFGFAGTELILIDEVLTPDSSRFWPADSYEPGGSQPSFDKQYVRDYLETLDWDKTPPGPTLPARILAASSDRYREAYRRITGGQLS